VPRGSARKDRDSLTNSYNDGTGLALPPYEFPNHSHRLLIKTGAEDEAKICIRDILIWISKTATAQLHG
jgi:hypothetical protein